MQPIRTLAAALLAVAALTACNGDSGPRTGVLAVALTDAPFPFDSVARADIYVVRIDAKLADAPESEAAGDPEGAENSTDPKRHWVTIATPDRSIDLLDLQRGVVTELGAARIPTGRYRGFRLILDTDRSTVTLKNGTVLRGNATPGIVWPSAGQTGVKVVLTRPIEVTADSTEMVIDFDLARSFVLRGTSLSQNGLLFKPVLHATARDITGSVSGTVRAGSATGALVPAAQVEVVTPGTTLEDTDASHVIATTSTDANGAFRAAFLLPGSYALRVTPPVSLTGFGPVIVPSVTVTAGQDAAGTAVILPAR